METRLPLLPRANTLLTIDAFDSMYNTEIAAVSAALDTLKAQRDIERADMLEHRNALQDATASLPPEIISHVLFYLSQGHTHATLFDPRQQFRWIRAAHVSRRWRAIALGTP